MKITLEEIQFPIFTKDNLFNDEFEKTRFIINLQDQIKEYAETKPILFPIPVKIADPALPRVILFNKNQDKKIEIGVNKIMVHFNNQNGETKINQNFIDHVKMIYNLLLNSKVNRIGLISTYAVSEFTEPAISCLRNKVTKDGNFEQPKEFNVIYNTESESPVNDIKMNNLITVRANVNTQEVILQTDINTLGEHRENKEFSLGDFDKIILDAIQKNKKVVDNFSEKISF